MFMVVVWHSCAKALVGSWFLVLDVRWFILHCSLCVWCAHGRVHVANGVIVCCRSCVHVFVRMLCSEFGVRKLFAVLGCLCLHAHCSWVRVLCVQMHWCWCAFVWRSWSVGDTNLFSLLQTLTLWLPSLELVIYSIQPCLWLLSLINICFDEPSLCPYHDLVVRISCLIFRQVLFLALCSREPLLKPLTR